MSDCLALIKKGNNPKPSGLITSGGTVAFLLHGIGKSKGSVVTAKVCEDGSDADYTPLLQMALSCND